MLTQIYEVSGPEEARQLADLGVDHMGVLVGPGAFPRERPGAEARATFEALPPGKISIALSLSDSPDEVARVIRETTPDVVHIGAAIELFSVDQTRSIKCQFPETQIMRAIPVVGEAAIGWARDYEGIADWLLLDSHAPGDRQIGAQGITHDWSISRRIVEAVSMPVILAGGLGPDNVAEAIKAVGPAGVDSKTKTDSTDGETKDLQKVAAFVEQSKGAG
ncbi:MAG: phosphoribosylanthranilate isomerase [Pseudomonadota bacterium]